MRTRTITAVALSSLFIAGAALAQDGSWATAEPLYGTVALDTGFTPDPSSHAVTAGGADEQTAIGAPAESCWGKITSAQPDLRVNYTAGETFPLRFYVTSDTDTTLIINAADGSWHCNDDGSEDGAGLNPVVHIDSPPSGQYDIWVGVFGDAGTASSTVHITELSSQGPASH